MLPINRVYLVTAWFESILYGINCVFFGICMYILLNRKKRAHRIILVSCIYHMSLATAHNILSLIQTLDAFTNPAVTAIPDGSSLYLLRTTALSMTKSGLYLINTYVLNLLLIWRLYVVWKCVWVLIVMLILQAVQSATATAAWALVLRSGVLAFPQRVNALAITSFATSLAVTVGATFGISFRLWRAGRRVFDFTGHNAYKFAMYSIIESGALYTCCTVVLISLVLAHNFIGDVTININIQITTMSPLLLIARLGYREDTPETTSATELNFVNPIQANTTEEIRIHPTDTMYPSSQSTRKSRRSYPDSDEQNAV